MTRDIESTPCRFFIHSWVTRLPVPTLLPSILPIPPGTTVREDWLQCSVQVLNTADYILSTERWGDPDIGIFRFVSSFYDDRWRSTLVQPTSTPNESIRSLRFVPTEHGVSVHGIWREFGRDIHSIISANATISLNGCSATPSMM